MVGRFAPSPSGRMHAGNVLCALAAWLSARAQAGHMILRIEDLDTQRCKPIYAAQLQADLRWLGLDWDEGGLEGGERYQQSKCTARYAAAFEQLAEKAYPCFCTRAALHAASAPHRADGQLIYPGTCRGLSAQEVAERMQQKPPAMRLRMPNQTISFTDELCGTYTESLAQACGDIVLRRADGVYAYQLAVVVDDAQMGVTEVVRGRDLLDSTPRQLYLYALFGWKPPSFLHIPLLCAPDGRRLAKRDQDLDMEVLRRNYTHAAPLLGKLAYFMGLLPQPEALTAQELISCYAKAKIVRQDIVLTEEAYRDLSGL